MTDGSRVEDAATVVAARADEEPGFEGALRAGLAALCDQLGLCGARAVPGAGPAVWHVARPGAMRDLLLHARQHSGPFEVASVGLAEAGPQVVQIEGFADAGQGRLGEMAAACSSFAAVLARKAGGHGPARDPLTGLLGRRAFLERLEKALERAKLVPGSAAALLFLDLDRFGRVNTSIGTAAGDAILLQAADRIRGAIPAGTIVARFGADEFTVLLENVRDPGFVLRTAERLQAVMRDPFLAEDMELVTTVSMGAAFSGPACATAHELLRDADTAMNRARARGPGRLVLWDSSMAGSPVARLQLEGDLRRALDNGGLEVGYQPIVSMTSGAITGFEALARWNHPELGAIPPSAFIPVAEEAGLIEKLGLSIIRDACRHLRSLEVGRRVPLSLSVNLSPRQLYRPELADDLAHILAETGTDPSHLRVEVTESALVENREGAASLLRRLRDMKVRIFLDDFGTGYSSLSYLHVLPVDGIKIDKSFVDALTTGPRAGALVGSILELARNLYLDVVAEGIETEQQAQLLRALRCPSGQGFLFSRATTSTQARALLQRGSNFWQSSAA